MSLLPFKKSAELTVGVELEYQIINPKTYNLSVKAKDLIRNVRSTKFGVSIKPEITQSMVEINSSIHRNMKTLYKELQAIQQFLQKQSKKLNILICGGGTHPFQKWTTKKIFPSHRFHHVSKRFAYLSKRSTVFGMHVHIGCKNAADSLYLTHLFSRFVPHLIAISASSPFCEKVDTGFDSSRTTIFNMFPLSGTIPYLTTWHEFSDYFYKFRNLGLIESMKDFYWDIRPKPEFGTVEIRVCDTPLDLQKVIIITAYIQTLAAYLLKYKPQPVFPDLYLVHNHNRFQAARHGLTGEIIDPFYLEIRIIAADILQTIDAIMPLAEKLGTKKYLLQLKKQVAKKENDSAALRALFQRYGDLKAVVKKQCELWRMSK